MKCIGVETPWNWNSDVYQYPMSIYLSTRTLWPFYCIFPLLTFFFFHFFNRKIEDPRKIKAKYPVNTRQWFKKSWCHCYCISVVSQRGITIYSFLKTFYFIFLVHETFGRFGPIPFQYRDHSIIEDLKTKINK